MKDNRIRTGSARTATTLAASRAAARTAVFTCTAFAAMVYSQYFVYCVNDQRGGETCQRTGRGDASQERATDGALMEQDAGLAAPKIAGLEFTPLEYALPREKAYGMARGLNFRRTVALVTA